MNRDFKSMAELLGYNETRILLNIDRYARTLLMMGDVFPPDRDGVYDRLNGDCILDFGRGGGYWVDRKNRKHPIQTLEDFEAANGMIYDFHDRRVVGSVERLRRLQVVAERPIVFKAQEAAAAVVADVIKNHHDFVNTGCNILDIDEALYMDVIEESPRRLGLFRSLEGMIYQDMVDYLNEYSWNDIWISKSANVYMLDVKIDIRIREWYEERFKRQDQEEELIRENGKDYTVIRCT